ncbi:MAG: lamin tail domain-containing protein, partial [Bacteroidota bacterium]|nr:lamin tail domain-containing protein [Bacteroidota bacterium]
KGTDYLLTLTNGITDCVGNPLSDKNYAHFALPQSPDSLDILINEILFNPFPDGTDFVEIYNHSSKVIDLADLSICTRDITSGLIKNCCVIAKNGRLIFPGEYVVITADRLKVQNHYLTPNDNCFTEVTAMPAINNEEGTVMLINRQAQMIDFFSYDKNMHFGLISNTEGVSLERINFDQSTNNASNWHSAAETVGYATPGYKNSQYNAQIDRSSEFSVSPEIFSPDNDGRDDLLHIHYKLDQPGFVANILIFDSRGREVKRLGRNVLLPSEGDLTWDGLDHRGGKASMGMYILFVELFNLNGEVRNIKKSFVLSEKL